MTPYEYALGLLSENGENPEYDRALADLLAELDPFDGQPHSERSDEILADLRRDQAVRDA